MEVKLIKAALFVITCAFVAFGTDNRDGAGTGFSFQVGELDRLKIEKKLLELERAELQIKLLQQAQAQIRAEVLAHIERLYSIHQVDKQTHELDLETFTFKPRPKNSTPVDPGSGR